MMTIEQYQKKYNFKVEPKRYSVEEVFDLIGENNLMISEMNKSENRDDIIVDGFIVRTKSLRYTTFYQKGLKCAVCGKEGTHFKLVGDPKTNRRHFELFADDDTLITKDHIFPKSKGGRDHIDNMQTMCCECNENKGIEIPDIEITEIMYNPLFQIEKEAAKRKRKEKRNAIQKSLQCSKKEAEITAISSNERLYFSSYEKALEFIRFKIKANMNVNGLSKTLRDQSRKRFKSCLRGDRKNYVGYEWYYMNKEKE